MAAAKDNKYSQIYTDEDIEELCKKLLDWAENSKSIHFAHFCSKVAKKSHSWLIEMSHRYPKLLKASDDARMLLSQKIIDACFNDKDSGVNAVFGERYLPIYDAEYRDYLKMKAEWSKSVTQNTPPVVHVHMKDQED